MFGNLDQFVLSVPANCVISNIGIKSEDDNKELYKQAAYFINELDVDGFMSDLFVRKGGNESMDFYVNIDEKDLRELEEEISSEKIKIEDKQGFSDVIMDLKDALHDGYILYYHSEY